MAETTAYQRPMAKRGLASRIDPRISFGLVEQLLDTGKALAPYPKGFHILNGGPASGAPSVGNYSGGKETRRLRRQQAALAAFGGFALGERDLNAVLTEAARVCAEGLEVPFCKVCRYRHDQNDLLVEAGVGWHQGVVGSAVSRADQSSPQGRAFTTGLPVICGNLQADSSFILPSFYGDHGIISSVDVVIKNKSGQPYGVLEVDSPVQHDYEIHDIDFLTGFANVLAEAVETSKRAHAQQVAFDRMQEMVADRDRLLATKTRLLADKNVLAEELQHRVRNNLQLVHGMISQQMQNGTSDAAKDGLRGIARRVMTLAQVYDHLLGTGLSRTIDFGSYLTALCSNIVSLQATSPGDVVLTCRSVPVILDLDAVTAVGLAISELVANSYEHAFPDGKGTIAITLSHDETRGEATLSLSDSGAGFLETVSKRHGLSLVKDAASPALGRASLRSWDPMDFEVSDAGDCRVKRMTTVRTVINAWGVTCLGVWYATARA